MPDRSSAAADISCAVTAPGRGIGRLADAAILDALASVLRSADKGHLHVTLPSGRSAVLGRGGTAADGAVEADLTISSYALIWKAMRRGLLGFADAYLCGDVDTSDLHALFRFFLDNEAAITAGLPLVTRSAPRDIQFHSRRRNTRTGSRRNIAAHYDLGNAFYELWLDRGMSYSSAIFTDAAATLEAAQAEKQARVLDALELAPAQEVLEIGCGWGGLAEAMAARGTRVTAITISKQQHVAASARLAAGRFAESCEVRFQDYRDTTGSFDRIASIEMIEAVGEENWPTYFETIRDRLKPGGQAVIQAITIRHDLFRDYRSKPDFIQRYIFPGGMLPSVPMMREQAERVGLDIVEIERFGRSYALTLAEWRARFIEAWPRIQALGFDERFRRMWLYYLTYCEVGFQQGTIDVGLYRMRKP